MKLKNLVGLRFGRFLVIRRAEYQNLHPYWECECECGTKKTVEGAALRRGNTKSCGCLRKDMDKCKPTGPDNPKWNHNLTEIQRQRKEMYRQSNEHTKWRLAIYKRDNHTCQVSGIRGGKLRAHHLYSFHSHPDLRCDINNGITLSYEVHKLFHKTYGIKNNTPEQFHEFTKRYKSNEFTSQA